MAAGIASLALINCCCTYITTDDYYIKPIFRSSGGHGHRLALIAGHRLARYGQRLALATALLYLARALGDGVGAVGFLSHREKHGATKPGRDSKRTVNR